MAARAGDATGPQKRHGRVSLSLRQTAGVIAAHRQDGYRLRADWGLDGALALTEDADVVVVVDVLSFTTTVTVAVEAGMVVWPYPWDQDAAGFAEAWDATLAVGRSQARAGQVSLSPVTVAAASHVSRLVLPSPNGSTIAHELQARGVEVLAACLRNAGAVARWLEENRHGRVVALVAAGERWPSGALRPAVEDLWGVGAVAAGLQEMGWSSVSVEAQVAAASYRDVAGDLADRLVACASGQELAQKGYLGDVQIAGRVNVSGVVPRLVDGSFTAA